MSGGIVKSEAAQKACLCQVQLSAAKAASALVHLLNGTRWPSLPILLHRSERGQGSFSAGDVTSEGTRRSNSALAAFMEGSADTLRRGASQSYAKWVQWVPPFYTSFEYSKNQCLHGSNGCINHVSQVHAGSADVLQSECCLLPCSL